MKLFLFELLLVCQITATTALPTPPKSFQRPHHPPPLKVYTFQDLVSGSGVFQPPTTTSLPSSTHALSEDHLSFSFALPTRQNEDSSSTPTNPSHHTKMEEEKSKSSDPFGHLVQDSHFKKGGVYHDKLNAFAYKVVDMRKDLQGRTSVHPGTRKNTKLLVISALTLDEAKMIVKGKEKEKIDKLAHSLVTGQRVSD